MIHDTLKAQGLEKSVGCPKVMGGEGFMPIACRNEDNP